MVTKKFYKIILCLLLIMCVGCQRKEVKVRTIYSDIYTEEEIQEAIDVIKKEFSRKFIMLVMIKLCLQAMQNNIKERKQLF